MTAKKFQPIACAIAILLFGLLAMPRHVLAHGGGQPRLVNEVIDQYLVSVWTNVEATLNGEQLHITVALADLDAAEPILNKTIFVSAQGGRTTVEPTQATHEKSVNKLYYEADLLLEHGGIWDIVVNVEGTEAGFQIETTGEPPSPFDYWPAVVIFVVAGLVGWNLPKFLPKKAS